MSRPRPEDEPPGSLRFEDFTFHPGSGELRRDDGATASLAPQPARVLEVLLQRAGEVVRREELYAEVWGDGVHVDYRQGLNYCIRQVRMALDEDARAPRFIETLPRRGYRFLASPERGDRGVDTSSAEDSRRPRPRSGGAGPGPRKPSRPTAMVGPVLVAVLLVAGAVLVSDAVEPSWFRRGADRPVPPTVRDGAPPATAASWSRTAAPAVRRPYLTARYLLGKARPEPQRAIDEYRRALRADPDFAPAHVGLADAYRMLAWWGGVAPRTGYRESLEAAERALALGLDSADVHLARGIAHLYRDLDWREAATDFDRARRAEPGNPRAWFWHARALSATGDHAAAVQAAERSLLLDPESRQIVVDLGWFHLFAGRYPDAVEQCRHALDLEPRSPAALQCLIGARTRLGETAAAAAASRQLLELFGVPEEEHAAAYRAVSEGRPEDYWGWAGEWLAGSCPVNSFATTRATLYTLSGDRDAALEQLEYAVERRHGWAPFIFLDPAFADLRDEPRFQALVGAVTPSSGGGVGD